MLPRALRTFGLLVAVASLLVPVTLAATNNDAGSGKDAPGLTSNAYRLPAYGTYTGYLDTEDRDAYLRAQAHADATCVSVKAASLATGDLRLNVSSSGAYRAAHARFGPGLDTRLAFAAPSVASSALMFHNHDPRDQGTYEFTLAALASADVERDSGTTGIVSDAPHLLEQAVAVSPGCIGGSLDPLALADLRDAFSFDAQKGATAVLSFAHDATPVPPQLELIAPDGTSLATLVSGAVAAIVLPTDGTYYLSASMPMSTSSSATDYVVGLILGPPNEEPCRPACMVVMG